MALFEAHKLNDAGMEKAQRIAAEFERLLESLRTIYDFNSYSRTHMAMVGHLETACFYAKKSMAVLPDNQEPHPNNT